MKWWWLRSRCSKCDKRVEIIFNRLPLMVESCNDGSIIDCSYTIQLRWSIALLRNAIIQADRHGVSSGGQLLEQSQWATLVNQIASGPKAKRGQAIDRIAIGLRHDFTGGVADVHKHGLVLIDRAGNRPIKLEYRHAVFFLDSRANQPKRL